MKKFNPTFLISAMVGLVFFSEGIQKFLFPEINGAGRFERLGVFYPHIMGYVIAATEVLFGALLLFRWKIKFVVLPLLGIMAGAWFYTKVPSFSVKGFWTTAHEARTDFLMTVSLIYLLWNSLKRK